VWGDAILAHFVPIPIQTWQVLRSDPAFCVALKSLSDLQFNRDEQTPIAAQEDNHHLIHLNGYLDPGNLLRTEDNGGP
jgi:hypothetical protein